MQLIKDIQKNPKKYLKGTGITLLILIALSIVLPGLQSVSRELNLSTPQTLLKSSPIGGNSPAYDSYYAEDAIEEASLSVRNIMPGNPTSTGNLAEDFEIKEYTARIETNDKDVTCQIIADLKADEDIIFENANDNETGCRYNFKVKNERASEVLAIVNSLDPRDLNESTYTIKQTLDDYTSEIDILEAKKASIESTLQDALTAYDQVTTLASNSNDIETLAKVIDSKLATIEKLTQQQILVNEQLDRIQRSKQMQLDRIDYTYFYVNISENKYIDKDDIKDSWKLAVKSFVRDVNESLQGLTIGLIYLLVQILQYGIYLFILLFVVKHGWDYIQSFWKK